MNAALALPAAPARLWQVLAGLLSLAAVLGAWWMALAA